VQKIGPETYVVKITKDSEDEEVDEELTEEAIEEWVSSYTTEADSYDEAEIIKTQKFISACKAGDTEQVKKLLDEGVNINCEEGEGFVQAVSRRHYKLFEYLISQGADVNAPNGVPMSTALIAEDGFMDSIQSGDMDKIKYYIEKGVDPCCKDFDAFYTACVVENEDVFEYLCAHTDKVKWFKYNNETYILFTEDQIVLRTTIEATLDELNNLDPDLKNYVGNMLAA